MCGTENDSIKILMCGNKNIFCGIILTVLSISAHTNKKIDLYIGTMDLSDKDERFLPITDHQRKTAESVLKKAHPESKAILVDFSESFRKELINSKNLGSGYTPYAMIRLFADEIDVGEKLLYLDTDVLFKGNPEDLWSINIDGYHIAGARDFFGKFFFSPRYLNSGVLLMNMNEMKKDNVFKKCRNLCNEKKMLLFDQHALNKYAKKKLILHRRYNEQHKTFDNTIVRHFAMTIKWFPYFHTETVKPWNPELVHEKLGDHSFDKIFEEYERMKEYL